MLLKQHQRLQELFKYLISNFHIFVHTKTLLHHPTFSKYEEVRIEWASSNLILMLTVLIADTNSL